MSNDGFTPNSSTSHIEDNNLPSKIKKDDSFHQDDQHKKYDERARLEILASTFGVDLEDALRSVSPESHALNKSILDEADTQKVVIFPREENQENDAEEKQIVTEGAIKDNETPIQWFGEFSEFESLSVSENEDTSVKKNPSVGNGWYKEIGNMPNEEQNSLESTDKIKINKNPDDIPTIPPGNISQETSLKPNHDLVQPVPEVDWQATSVIPAAYKATVKSNGDKVSSTVKPKIKRREKRKTKKTPGCFLRAFLFMFFAGILLLLIIASVGIYQYFRIASSLPNVEELQTRTSQFETTRILDRNGNKLYEIIDPNAGKRTYIPLENISPYLIAATIATEDKEFYNHPGFDPVALMRALWTNYTSGGIVSGASTITQQLARMLLLPDERFEQSYARKAREIILAAEIERRYTKEQILELYLNEIYYGNMAYGIQAASETYFNTTAKNLSLWQAAFLAGLPQTPSVYDVYTNREATLARNRDVLVLMYEMSLEKNCIYVSTNTANVCVDAVQALQAAETLENHTFVNNNFSIKFPHWVVYIQSILETQYDPQTIYRSGFTVYTTLDPDLQLESERAVREQINTLKANNATNGALIAMDPATGEILAMVGSADFYDEKISGQVNMATTQTRQPGSSIKPITYLAAFEKDWTPSTLIWDVPSEFPPSGNPDDTRPAYEPVNYDGRFHGPVTVRSALANSYNIPAVKALAYVGIYDDPTTSHPDGFIETAKRLGITSLTRNDYGLSLTLGGGEVSLLEMTGAYSVFANSGRKVSPVAITKIVDHNGNVMYSYEPPSGDQIIRPEHAYLLSSMLSDKQARIPAFGTDPVTNLSFQAAVKTGTTNDFRDNWTIGYTPDMVVGVWVGNADYSPMQNTSGLTGAAPIWARVMEFGISHLTNGNPSPFVQPAGIVDRVICSISGAEPSELCPEQRSEIFASDQLPLPKTQDLWVEVSVDTWTGLRASDDCNEFVDEKLAINVTDKTAIKWLTENSAGKSWAEKYGFPDPLFFVPKRACRVDDSRPLIKLHTISDGQTIKISPLQIIGVIDATSNFKEFRIDYGLGPKPDRWRELVDNTRRPVKTTDLIYEWDISELKPGLITLRITVYSQNDTYAIKKYSLILDVPTPTPTTTMTPTETQTEAPTSTPTETSTITPTYTPTSTSTPTQTPTETPTPTSTPE